MRAGIQINAITKEIKSIFEKLGYTDKADNLDVAMYLTMIDNAPATASKLIKRSI